MIIIKYTSFCLYCFCFFKQKTSYEMRISDWSSDVCSSDLFGAGELPFGASPLGAEVGLAFDRFAIGLVGDHVIAVDGEMVERGGVDRRGCLRCDRSEEHTSELQSLMRISYAVFCLKKKKKTQTS